MKSLRGLIYTVCGLLIVFLTSCVSTGGATALGGAPVVNPQQLEQQAIEAELVMGSPESLVRAVVLAESARYLPPDRIQVYKWLSYELARLVYPEFMASAESPRDVPQNDPLVRLFIESRNGRSVNLPENPTAFEELLPALAVFRLRTLEIASLALNTLERFSSLGAASSLAAYIKGLALERVADPVGAQLAYHKALALGPDNYQAALALAALFTRQGNTTEALYLLDGLDQLLFKTLVYRRAMANALYAAGRYSEALPVISMVLMEEPSNSAFMLMRAHLLIENKEYRQAQPLLDAYASVDGNNRMYLLLRARVAMEFTKDRRNALVFLRRALDRYPGDRVLALYTANVLNTGGTQLEQAEAVTLARTVLAADPASREALGILLAAELRASNFSSAASYADSLVALGLKPSEYEVVYKAYRNEGRTEDFRKIAVDWYKVLPESESARIAYLTMLVESGQSQPAATMLTALLAGRGSASYKSALHWLNSRLQTNQEAVLNSLRTALVEDSMNLDALLAMYDHFVTIRDYQRAAFYLKQAYALAPARREVLTRRNALNQLGFAIP